MQHMNLEKEGCEPGFQLAILRFRDVRDGMALKDMMLFYLTVGRFELSAVQKSGYGLPSPLGFFAPDGPAPP